MVPNLQLNQDSDIKIKNKDFTCAIDFLNK